MSNSADYTISYLVQHPLTKPLMLKYLIPLRLREERMKRMQATLDDIRDGLPHDIATPLIAEINDIIL